MLQKSKSKKINQLKYLVVIPSLVLFLISCNSEVIENETEKEQQLKSNPITKIGYRISSLSDDKQPIFVANGKVISSEEMNAIIPDSIKSMNLLKGETAIKTYGEKAKNGAIEISTSWETRFIIGKSYDVKVIGYGDKPHNTSDKFTIKAISTTDGKAPLIIVDGKEILDKNIEDIDPDTIESTNVLKDENATKLYGNKAKNGVVIITTKK